MHGRLGPVMTTRYKTAKTQLPLLRCQERKQGTAHDSCTGHHQGGGQTTWASNPVQCTHLPLRSPHGRNQSTLLGEWARVPVSSSCSLCCSTSPSIALPELLIWPLTSFQRRKSPGTQVGNPLQHCLWQVPWGNLVSIAGSVGRYNAVGAHPRVPAALRSHNWMVC